MDLKKRHRKETRFKLYGLMAVLFSFLFLGFLLFSIISKGYSSFYQYYATIPLQIPVEAEVNEKFFRDNLKALYPDITERKDLVNLYSAFSKNAPFEARKQIADGKKELYITLNSEIDIYLKKGEMLGKLNEKQIELISRLEVKPRFNWYFLQESDSRSPEIAGILGALKGSFFVIFVALIISFPIGVATAIYLEEFAPKNLFTDIIEINVNNLAAVPSIIFGLLGLAVYLVFMDLPRSSSLVGGMTIALLVLPTIVIAARTSLKTVPQSIKDGAIAVGASKMQVLFHHVLPIAMPGITTGTILAIARALGETAPLIMIGMVAFISQTPTDLTDPATAMPVQIYLWSDSIEPGFVEKTSGAIMILLIFLVMINMTASYIRKKFEKKW